MRPLPERTTARERREAAGRVAVDAAGLDERGAPRRPGQKPSTSSQNHTNGEKPSYTWGRSTSSGPKPGLLAKAGATVSAPPSMMSSSGQCSGSRRAVGVPAGVPGDVHRPVRQVLGPLGRREDERRDAVDGDVAV